jgi:preprotein translocase subunit SecF
MAVNFSQWGNDLYTGKRNYQIVAKRKIWFTIAIITVIICAVLLFKPGLKLGIEFEGGTEFRVTNTETTAQTLALDAVGSAVSGESPKVASLGTNGVRVQTSQLSQADASKVMDALAKADPNWR